LPPAALPAGLCKRAVVDPSLTVLRNTIVTRLGARGTLGVMNDADAFSAMYEREGERLLTPSANGVILYTPKQLMREYSFTSPAGARINRASAGRSVARL
jgi:hypothetical protein